MGLNYISVNLSKYFIDHRKLSRVSIKHMKRMRELYECIQNRFNLEPGFILICGDDFLPIEENIYILNQAERIEVIPNQQYSGTTDEITLDSILDTLPPRSPFSDKTLIIDEEYDQNTVQIPTNETMEQSQIITTTTTTAQIPTYAEVAQSTPGTSCAISPIAPPRSLVQLLPKLTNKTTHFVTHFGKMPLSRAISLHFASSVDTYHLLKWLANGSLRQPMKHVPISEDARHTYREIIKYVVQEVKNFITIPGVEGSSSAGN